MEVSRRIVAKITTANPYIWTRNTVSLGRDAQSTGSSLCLLITSSFIISYPNMGYAFQLMITKNKEKNLVE